MAYDLPAVPGIGDVATVANWAQKVIDSLTYLKAETDLYDAHDAADAQTAHVTLGAHGIGDHTDVTRTKFINTMGCLTDGTVTNINNHQIVELADAAEKYVYIEFDCPNDFVSIATFKVVWSSPAGGGLCRMQCETDYAANGENHSTTHGEDTGEDNYAAGGAALIHQNTLVGVFADLAKGDFCGLKLRRHGDDAQDTLGDVMRLFGFLLTYTAEQ